MLLSRRQLLAAVGITVIAAPAVAHASPPALTGEVSLGDWERYYLGLDGGAHQRALKALGIAHRDGVRADEPHRLVPIKDVARAVVDHGDHAAADYLRDRLKLDTPSMLREGLKVIHGEDRLEERYLRDPILQLRTIGHFPRFRGHTLTLPESVVKTVKASA
ncbi:hypothetical protein Lesp02_83560 [Lentzea sp. NBRC 105346]|uniref:hypothetical protein n=1 Tax=Lentzea sp. NBRC 105346 TaxID=3032205 RepID=UPI0024A17CBD|nr:hypothetical protein [Lentzea sp. NBRC 105346]GLZ36169.1 hypothetical protein Lesp02_83560 [Lentzea sp. NBRC 105346]